MQLHALLMLPGACNPLMVAANDQSRPPTFPAYPNEVILDVYKLCILQQPNISHNTIVFTFTTCNTNRPERGKNYPTALQIIENFLPLTEAKINFISPSEISTNIIFLFCLSGNFKPKWILILYLFLTTQNFTTMYFGFRI